MLVLLILILWNLFHSSLCFYILIMQNAFYNPVYVNMDVRLWQMNVYKQVTSYFIMSTALSQLIFIFLISIHQSIVVVTWSKVHTVLKSANTGIMGLTITGSLLYVGNFLCSILCTWGLVMCWSLIQGDLQNVKMDL